MQRSFRNMQPPTSPLEQQPTTINLYQGLGFLPGKKRELEKKERLNQTLLSMFRTSPENQKSRWKDSLNKFIQAYYCPCDETTGFSRYYLLCGQFPRLPIHPILELSLLLPQNIQLMSVKMENSHEGG